MANELGGGRRQRGNGDEGKRQYEGGIIYRVSFNDVTRRRVGVRSTPRTRRTTCVLKRRRQLEIKLDRKRCTIKI